MLQADKSAVRRLDVWLASGDPTAAISGLFHGIRLSGCESSQTRFSAKPAAVRMHPLHRQCRCPVPVLIVTTTPIPDLLSSGNNCSELSAAGLSKSELIKLCFLK